jgi:hypothetical protein
VHALKSSLLPRLAPCMAHLARTARRLHGFINAHHSARHCSPVGCSAPSSQAVGPSADAVAATCRFQAEAGCRVLLMQMANHTGAAGLNLTCASHAYLMEPAMAPAIEAQAAARIYRLGEASHMLTP